MTLPAGSITYERALPAEGCERLEERRAHATARDGHADRRLRLGQLQPVALPDGGGDVVQHGRLPRARLVLGDRVVEDGGGRAGHRLAPRRLVDRGLLEEQEVDPGGHLGEGGDPFLHQRRQLLEPREVEALRRPRGLGLQPRQGVLHELARVEGADVRAVEVVELLAVEERR